MPRKAEKNSKAHSMPTIFVQALRQLCVFLLTFALAIPPTWIASMIVHTPLANGSTYAEGYSKYQKGDFKSAQSALNVAVKKKGSKASTAKTYKLLGIVQFMLGNKPGANLSFRRALKLNPASTISENEVLDTSVLGFFNGIKGGGKKPTKPLAQAPKPKPAAPTPVAADTPGKSAKGLKKTFVKVLSNVPNASVSIDGILAGQVNTLINAEPGKIMLDVVAPGYIDRNISVNITANQENPITVNLIKPAPKPKPKPKIKPKAKPKLAKAKIKKKKKGNKYAPDPGKDMFDEPGGGGGAPAGGPDLASQFEMEAGGGYAAPPPGYGAQPPGYGAPPPGYGAPPPQYYAPPPPQYYAPPPPQYYAPPLPPPPPADPYGGGGYVEPGAPPVEAAPDPAAPAAGPAGDKGGSGNNLFISLLPFGAGQFQNGSTFLGVFFLGAEGAGIYYYMTKTKEADAFAAAANTYIKDNCQTEDADTDACAKYQTDSQTYVNGVRGKAQMGLYAFLGLWVAGAAESIINEPAPETKSKSKKKKRRYGGFSYTPTPEGHHFSLVGKEFEKSLFAYDVGVQIAPNWSPATEKVENDLSMSLTLEF